MEHGTKPVSFVDQSLSEVKINMDDVVRKGAFIAQSVLQRAARPLIPSNSILHHGERSLMVGSAIAIQNRLLKIVRQDPSIEPATLAIVKSELDELILRLSQVEKEKDEALDEVSKALKELDKIQKDHKEIVLLLEQKHDRDLAEIRAQRDKLEHDINLGQLSQQLEEFKLANKSSKMRNRWDEDQQDHHTFLKEVLLDRLSEEKIQLQSDQQKELERHKVALEEQHKEHLQNEVARLRVEFNKQMQKEVSDFKSSFTDKYREYVRKSNEDILARQQDLASLKRKEKAGEEKIKSLVSAVEHCKQHILQLNKDYEEQRTASDQHLQKETNLLKTELEERDDEIQKLLQQNQELQEEVQKWKFTADDDFAASKLSSYRETTSPRNTCTGVGVSYQTQGFGSTTKGSGASPSLRENQMHPNKHPIPTQTPNSIPEISINTLLRSVVTAEASKTKTTSSFMKCFDDPPDYLGNGHSKERLSFLSSETETSFLTSSRGKPEGLQNILRRYKNEDERISYAGDVKFANHRREQMRSSRTQKVEHPVFSPTAKAKNLVRHASRTPLPVPNAPTSTSHGVLSNPYSDSESVTAIDLNELESLDAILKVGGQ